MGKHTPGPWQVAHSGVYPVVETREGVRIATFPYAFNADSIEADANLTAAAPQLLLSLKEMLVALPARRDWLDPMIEAMAKDAIQKAEGRA